MHAEGEEGTLNEIPSWIPGKEWQARGMHAEGEEGKLNEIPSWILGKLGQGLPNNSRNTRDNIPGVQRH